MADKQLGYKHALFCNEMKLKCYKTYLVRLLHVDYRDLTCVINTLKNIYIILRKKLYHKDISGLSSCMCIRSRLVA